MTRYQVVATGLSVGAGVLLTTSVSLATALADFSVSVGIAKEGQSLSGVSVERRNGSCVKINGGKVNKKPLLSCEAVVKKIEAVTAADAKKLESYFAPGHVPHFVVEYKSAKASWKKLAAIAEIESCDRKGKCEKSDGGPKEVRELALAVLKVAE